MQNRIKKAKGFMLGMINIMPNLFLFFSRKITGHSGIRDYDGDKYLSIINNEKGKSMLLKFNTMWKEIKQSIRGKNDVL